MIFSLVLALQLAASKQQDSGCEAVVVGSGVRIQEQIKQLTNDGINNKRRQDI